MSKTQLKKELAQLDRDQLAQLILDLYSARKEAKEYFDFFIDPDVPKLYEKFRADIEKEMTRGKYSNSNARISRIRKSIRQFESFGVGAESVIDLMLYTLGLSLVVERRKYVSKPFINGMARLAGDILILADKRCLFDSTHKLLSQVLDGKVGSKNFVNFIRRSISWSPL